MAETQKPTAEAREGRSEGCRAGHREVITAEVAGTFKSDLKRVMKARSINNQQDVHQRLLINLTVADLDAQAKVLLCVTPPIVVTEKVSRIIRAAGLKSLDDDQPEPDDEIDIPNNLPYSLKRQKTFLPRRAFETARKKWPTSSTFLFLCRFCFLRAKSCLHCQLRSFFWR
ncbi:hypothetical protein [Pseudomonas sp. Z3-8]|uniref:hypothetical protein n=1 Tax=Pseudomonas sp. Z3-8 TaxID=2817412 RepID=UPI003DA97631